MCTFANTCNTKNTSKIVVPSSWKICVTITECNYLCSDCMGNQNQTLCSRIGESPTRNHGRYEVQSFAGYLSEARSMVELLR